MAQLRNLDEKLAEVLGLAQAAKGATEKVEKLVEDDDTRRVLAEMREEAAEMMDTYLGQDAEGLDGFEFLIMAEAGELGHWEILKTLNEQAGIGAVRELTEFAIPVQQRHERITRQTALALAGAEDPLDEA